jgi:hypothetical protein
MADELPVYSDSNIQITNLRATLYGKTFAMANITSVAMHTQYANKAPGVIVALLGAVFGLVALASSELRGCFLVFAAVMILIGVVYIKSQHNNYWVRIGSSSGEANALSSHDHEYVSRVVAAMNEAIVRRG